MVNADEFNTDESAPLPAATKPKSRKLLIGCLSAVVIVVLLMVGAFFYLKAKIVDYIATEVRAQAINQINDSALPDDQKKALIAVANRVGDDLKEGRISVFDPKSMASGAQNAAHDAVNELDLPAEQKSGILQQVDRVADGFKDDKITAQQIQQIGDKLIDGPFAGAILVWGVEAKYVFGSTLTGDEQHDASLQMRRVLRGYAEKKITRGQIDPHLDEILEPNPADPSSRRLKEHLSPDEFKQFVDGLKTEADQANVPDEMYQLDFAAQLKQAVDDVIGAGAP